MKRRFVKNNEGYSLIELIIVIGIIAVMTAAAMVTITMMNSAKCKEAATTFESELSDLQARSKNQVCKVYDEATHTYNETTEYVYAMRLYVDSNDKVYIQKGYYKIKGADIGSYISFKDENKNDGMGVSLSSKVHIQYDPKFDASYSAAKTLDDYDINFTGKSGEKGVIIAYNKDGSVVTGYGDYYFAKNNKKKDGKHAKIVAQVSVKVNGGSQSY